MQIKIDTTADALYIRVKKGKVSKTKNKGDHLIDYDKKGNLLGLEILNFSRNVPAGKRELISVVNDRKLSLPA